MDVPNRDMPNLSIKEAAERTGYSYHTLYRAIRRGELPSYGPTRLIKLKPSEVLAWAEKEKAGVAVPLSVVRVCKQSKYFNL